MLRSGWQIRDLSVPSVRGRNSPPFPNSPQFGSALYIFQICEQLLPWKTLSKTVGLSLIYSIEHIYLSHAVITPI